MNLIMNLPCFLMESLAHQGCIYFKNTEKNSDIGKYYCNF